MNKEAFREIYTPPYRWKIGLETTSRLNIQYTHVHTHTQTHIHICLNVEQCGNVFCLTVHIYYQGFLFFFIQSKGSDGWQRENKCLLIEKQENKFKVEGPLEIT